MTTENKNTIHDFSNISILVIGDIMIDQYWYGKVNRISPEAPVPILQLESKENRLGGAANVALNLLAMGAKTQLLGMIGDDESVTIAKDLISDSGLKMEDILVFKNRKTTLKSRIMAKGQHLLRVDHETTHQLSPTELKRVIQKFEDIINHNDIQGIILQDYNKGFLHPTLIKKIIKMANDRNIKTFVDPKTQNFYAYKGCTVFKPNKKEAFDATNINLDNIEGLIRVDNNIRKQLSHKYSFITLGKEGVFISDGKIFKKIDTRTRSISDVCGAGDSVMAIISLYLLKNIPIDIIAELSNIAGGQVCEVPGVSPIEREKFITEVKQRDLAL